MLISEELAAAAEEIAADDESLLLLRMLKKKKRGGGSNLSDFYDYYSYDSWQQWIRISYCILCIHSSLKVLNVAQFNENIAFLVKILSKVFHNLLPFFLLWFAI